MAFSKPTITNAGRDLMLDCMASGDFQIHSLVLGSGQYSGILQEAEAVITPEASFEGESLSVARSGDQIKVRARLTNAQLETGFYWREYGVYATNGTKTVLYAYDNAGSDAIPITDADGGAGISNVVEVILTVAQAATVNVTFQPPADVVVDAAVTQTGENPVSGKAVHDYVGATAVRFDAAQTLTPEQQAQARQNIGAGDSKVPASNVTAGTFGGMVKANPDAVADITVAMVRNIMCGMADVNDVLDSLNVGDIYFTVEEAT